MYTFWDVLRNFFTHKDFLPPPEVWPGTLFSPLQIIFCLLVTVGIGFAAFYSAKLSEAQQKRIFFILWLIMLITEPGIVLWEALAGKEFMIEWSADLSLWGCSIFLYAAPFAIFGKGDLKWAACGYICTLGLIGGAVNFFYPATYLSRYSCISMAGFRTVFYHGSMLFTAITMLLSGYHRFTGVTTLKQVFLPILPLAVVSIPALIADFTISGADYLFFKLESFFFKPIGAATPDWLSVIMVYAAYLVIHCVPYFPSYLKNRKG